MKKKWTTKWSRKKLIGVGVTVGILGACLALEGYSKAPVNAITIDVNPSIELQTNRLNEVVKVNPLNKDAEQMLKGFKIKDPNLNDVVEDVVDRMVFTGHISGGSDNVVMLSVDEDNQNPDMVDKVNQTIAAYLEKRQVEASVLTQSVTADKADKQLADDKDVSPGKLTLIQKIMDGDKSLTFEDLSSISLKELLLAAEKINIDTDNLFDQYFIALDGSVKSEKDDQPLQSTKARVHKKDDHDVADDKENNASSTKSNHNNEKFDDDADDYHDDSKKNHAQSKPVVQEEAYDDDRHEEKEQPKKKQATAPIPVKNQEKHDDDHDDWDDDEWDDDNNDDFDDDHDDDWDDIDDDWEDDHDDDDDESDD